MTGIQVSPAGRCTSCGARVLWAWTESGRRIPVDLEPSPEGSLRLVRRGTRTVAVVTTPLRGDVHRPHLATCPKGRQ